ncbi:lipooligosaccharide transport system, OM translocon component LptE [Campylobacter blaseri]|uniref:Penicillin-binding protein n=1 Tax=Campylobacter blaseri TaxID=2042961 RepID=A0A2P8R1Y8_9BACT|nr:LPS assembly lipoprotein LptE [Campylobacter blaseri]PSM52510.1 penicillin-binding protein [Campylobacter blaseri]PSM54158.1 penicillin-binding protein [Campylobacter blaseri]QKF85806.1 lipooligosaccharide transport system, OM translocon component LptE [Campylobacter blaseri]
MRRFIYVFLLVFLVGCGYKPVSKISDNILADSVFVDVSMSKTDPQNTVAIKDAVRSGIVSRLHKRLAPRDIAQTYIIASIQSLSFSVLAYDQYGYATSYRANLALNFKTKLKDGSVVNIKGVGDHDFRVTRVAKTKRDTSSVISDKERYDAIQNASSQAFNEFIATLAIRSFKEQKEVNATK